MDHRKACASKRLVHSCMWGDECARGIGGASGTVAALLLYSKPESPLSVAVTIMRRQNRKDTSDIIHIFNAP